MAKYDIFISYSRLDTDIINPILDNLKSQGYNIWIDTEGKYHSEKFRGKIVKAIKNSKCLIFFSSKNSNSSEWVRREINVADEENKPIIPFILDDTGYDDEIRLTLTGIERIDSLEMTMKKCLEELDDTVLRIISNYNDEDDPLPPTPIEPQNKIKKCIFISLLILGSFILVYAIFFGSGYFIERITNGSDINQQVELNQHISYRKDVINYTNHGLSADYYLSTDTVIIKKNELYYSLKSEDFWRAASISTGFYLWAKNLKKIPGDNRTKAGIAITSFFGVLFGYSQGNYLGAIHNMQQTQESMEEYLQDSDNWIYLKQSYLKRKELINE